MTAKAIESLQKSHDWENTIQDNNDQIFSNNMYKIKHDDQQQTRFHL